MQPAFILKSSYENNMLQIPKSTTVIIIMNRLILALTLLTPLFAIGEELDLAGKVGDIRYHDSILEGAPAWKGVTWIEVIADNGKTICGNNKFSIPAGNDTAVSIALAAKMSDRTVEVRINNTSFWPSGYSTCKLQHITIK